jgi:glycosyl transferase family 87
VLSDRNLQDVFGLRPQTVALWGGMIRAGGGLLTGLVLAVLALSYTQAARNTAAVRHLQDFGIFYESARQVRAGGEMYDVTLLPGADETGDHSNLNPPHFHLLVLPFTYLAPAPAFVAWLALSAAALVGSCLLVQRSLQLSTGAMLAMAGLAVAWAPMFATLLTGQVGPILLLPFTMAWYRARQKRYVEAGAWIGLCASVKPFFLLFFVYFALLRRFRAVLAAAGTLTVMFVAGLVTFGVSPHLGWIEKLATVTWGEHYMNASILGLIERSFSRAQWPATPAIEHPWIVATFWLLLAVPVAIVALVRLGRLSPDRQFLVVTITALLVSPLGWIYYGWFLLPPFAACCKSGELSTSGRALLFFAVGTLGFLIPPPVPWTILSWRDVFSTVTFGSVYSWALIAFWFASISISPTSSGPALHGLNSSTRSEVVA